MTKNGTIAVFLALCMNYGCLLCIAYVLHNGIDLWQHAIPPAELLAQDQAQREANIAEHEDYLREHPPQDAAVIYQDAGLEPAYPDGGMSATRYIEHCRMLCETPRRHFVSDPPPLPGVPHVLSVNPEANTCTCWRPDRPYWGPVEVYYNWSRRSGG